MHWRLWEARHIRCELNRDQMVVLPMKKKPNGELWRMEGGILTSLHLLAVFRHVIWETRTQEFNVVITVVLGHLHSTGFGEGDRFLFFCSNHSGVVNCVMQI